MKLKKTGIIIFMALSMLPAYRIYAQASNITKIIGENTPSFFAEPITLAVNAMEKFRIDMILVLQNKKEETQNQIDALNKAKVPSRSVSEVGKFLKYFKYAELYLFTLLFIIFNSKLIFYGIFAFIIFLILRYIMHLII